MTDTRKEFERAVSNLGWAFDYIGDGQYGSHTIQFANKLWQACQSLNDKRMLELIQQNNDLLAVIAKKDEALKAVVGWQSKPVRQAIVNEAISIKPEDVELVEVGYVTHFDMEKYHASKLVGTATGDKLYTIKTKDLS